MHRNTRTTLPQYYEMKLLSDPPPKRSAEDILFDYLDPEERRIYNDLARRIQKRFEELESEKSKRRDRSTPHCVMIAGKPEVTGSSVGFVPTNALVLSGLANSWIVGKPEAIRGSGKPILLGCHGRVLA